MKNPATSIIALFALANLVACGGANGTAGRSFTPSQSLADQGLSRAGAAELARQRAAAQQKLDNGYLYQVRGTVHTIDVAAGKLPVFHLGPGDRVTVALVPPSSPRYVLGGQRHAMGWTNPEQCDDCAPASTPSSPPQTTPPNFGPCSSSGGATWYNASSGVGGCTPRGGTQPLTCGSWTWTARGKGTLTAPGSGTFGDLDWVTDNGDGSCTLGYLS